MSEIKIADTNEKVLHCLEAIQSLRPHVTKEDVFEYINKMRKENYHILYVEENEKAVAFSGYRFITHFFTGDSIYIDDLGTIAEYRGKGYGSKLLNHILNIAKENKFREVHLDSAHHRYDAHRLYLNKGYKIVSHHFSLQVEQ